MSGYFDSLARVAEEVAAADDFPAEHADLVRTLARAVRELVTQRDEALRALAARQDRSAEGAGRCACSIGRLRNGRCDVCGGRM